MKKLLALGNKFAAQSKWWDFALLKFCLASLGLFIGLFIPDRHKKCAMFTSVGVFAATYAFLIARFFDVISDK